MRYIIWDFDGTLAWRRGRFTGALLAVLEEASLDVQLTAEQLRPHLKTGFPWHSPSIPHPELNDPDLWWQTLQPVFAKAYNACGIDSALATELASRVRASYCDIQYWQLYTDTLETLRRLNNGEWQHVILSNHVPELRNLIEQLGVSPYLVGVFNSAETGYEKPHPLAFRHVLNQLGDYDSIWMIGDSWTADIVGAKAMGIPSILVRNSHLDARWSCPSLVDVIRLLDASSQASVQLG